MGRVVVKNKHKVSKNSISSKQTWIDGVAEDFRNKKEKFSIIIPTMWYSDKIFKMLSLYEASPFVGEVIIIDNRPIDIDLSSYKKIRYYTKGKNLYVNPSWNWGASLAKHSIILANDDIIISNLDSVLSVIKRANYDIIGVSTIPTDEIVHTVRIDEFPGRSYGCFMYVKNYTYISEQFKIWYGDYMLFNNCNKKGLLKGVLLTTNKSTTVDKFRNTICKQDIKEFDSFINPDKKRLNILIRTSGRPNYFNKCIESIKKYCPNAILHITVDNEDDLIYVKKCPLSFKYYLINKNTVECFCKKIDIKRNIFIYNYYFNIIKPFVNGWCMFLDDDDELVSEPSFADNENNIYLHKVDIGIKIVPSDINFGKTPTLNDISGIGIIFHSANMADWLPERGGDFGFIERMSKNHNIIWVDKILSKTQTGGNFGKRNDLIINDKPVKKKITVNMATYPPRKDATLKVLNSLLKISFIDTIRVYLNEYKEVPDIFPKADNIIYMVGGDNLKDSGKFYWADSLKDEYYFTIDDDLIYSEKYFKNHLLSLKEYNDNIFVTTHGKVMKQHPIWMNDSNINFKCLGDQKEDAWVNNGGTGVMVFDNSKYIIPKDIFEYHGMADLCIGLYLQKQEIPILCRKHKKSELTYLFPEDPTLFDIRNTMHEDHLKLLKQVEWKINSPVKNIG